MVCSGDFPADVEAMSSIKNLPKRIPLSATVLFGLMLGYLMGAGVSHGLKSDDGLVVCGSVALSALAYVALLAFTSFSDD